MYCKYNTLACILYCIPSVGVLCVSCLLVRNERKLIGLESTYLSISEPVETLTPWGRLVCMTYFTLDEGGVRGQGCDRNSVSVKEISPPLGRNDGCSCLPQA